MNSEAFFMVGEDSSDLFAINSSLATEKESAGFHYKGFLCVCVWGGTKCAIPGLFLNVIHINGWMVKSF